MDVTDYLIDQQGIEWPTLLRDWSPLLPESFTLWLVNRFGDSFVVFDDGSVNMLDIGAGLLERLADTATTSQTNWTSETTPIIG